MVIVMVEGKVVVEGSEVIIILIVAAYIHTYIHYLT